MTSSDIQVMIVAVACLLAVASAGHIRNSAVKTVRRDESELTFTCVERASLCAIPLAMMLEIVPQDVLLEQIRQEGIGDICRAAIRVKECIQSTLDECDDDDELPAQLRQAFYLVKEAIGFVCVQQIDAINAQRLCLYSDANIAAAKTQCGEGSGEICQLVEDSECSIALFERTCVNSQQLANSYRAFVQRVELESNCDTVVSMQWRQLLNVLRRR